MNNKHKITVLNASLLNRYLEQLEKSGELISSSIWIMMKSQGHQYKLILLIISF